ncbi:MAG: amino acid racemase [Campylobacteraceae bacterium]|nr:amino acid racemase [Campylobacteraceae bacterium]
MKRVGIIGGMGSLASADLYSKIVSLTDAKCDQDHILLTIDNNSQVPDRTAFIFGKGDDPRPYLIDSVKRLENSGCKAFCMACNTAHYFSEYLEKNTKMKLLHMPKIAVESIVQNYPNAKNIAVVATTGTRKTGIYDKVLDECGLKSVEFTATQEKAIMECIYDGVKAGKTDEYIEFFNKTIESIEADIYIAACTEIPMFIPYTNEKYKFIDATNELAKAVIKFAKS